MKIQPYVQKLNSSNEFKQFIGKNKDAYLIAGFFVLDFESGSNIHQIDYYVPSQKKVAAFTLDQNVDMKMLDMLTEETPKKLDIKTSIDLDALKGIIEDEMKNRNMTEQILKIIAVIQSIKGDKIWSVNCVLSGMEILKAHIEDKSKSVLKMEKSSVMDYLKKMPMAQLPKKKVSKGDLDNQLNQLDKLKDALKKQKEEMSQQSAESDAEGD